MCLSFPYLRWGCRSWQLLQNWFRFEPLSESWVTVGRRRDRSQEPKPGVREAERQTQGLSLESSRGAEPEMESRPRSASGIRVSTGVPGSSGRQVRANVSAGCSEAEKQRSHGSWSHCYPLGASWDAQGLMEDQGANQGLLNQWPAGSPGADRPMACTLCGLRTGRQASYDSTRRWWLIAWQAWV